MNRFFKIVSWLLFVALFFVFSPMPAPVAQNAVPQGWIGIFSREDLEKISSAPAEKYILMNDLDLSDGPLSPLCSEEDPFTGILDGNGYCIYGVTVVESDGARGLFSAVEGGEIRSLSVSASVSGSVAGGIVGKMGNGVLRDCTSLGSVTATFCGGGLVGQIYGSEVLLSDCKSTSAVSVVASEEAWGGGICGSVFGSGTVFENCLYDGALSLSSSSAFGGGTVGFADGDVTFKNCGTEGTLSLTCKGTARIGGIVGASHGESVFEGCIFGGVWDLFPVGDTYLGGICGYALAERNFSVSECFVYGALSAETLTTLSAGGIVGTVLVSGGTSTVSRCGVFADLSFEGNPIRAGGIVGTQRADVGIAVVEDCHFNGFLRSESPINVDPTFGIGGIVGINGGWGAAILRRCFSSGAVESEFTFNNGAVVGISRPFTEEGQALVEECYYPMGSREFFATAVPGNALANSDSFDGFDFSAVWQMDKTCGLPRLRAAEGPSEAPAKGDLDGNGRITRYDATLLLQYLTGKILLSPGQSSRADVDGDGLVTAADAALILRNTN